MTDYERVKTELNRLGWAETPSKGDHFKFRKAGVPECITLSLNLSQAGRAYQNTLAKCRRLEPEFSLGRPERSAKTGGTLTPEQEAVRRRRPFIAPGEAVRYVTPENRDYSRLQSADAVMSHEYRVMEIATDAFDGLVGSEDDLVTIRGEHDGQELIVKASELESWKTAACDECGTEVPESELDGDVCGICPSCVKVAQERISTYRAKYGGDIAYTKPLEDLVAALPKSMREELFRRMGRTTGKAKRGERLGDLSVYAQSVIARHIITVSESERMRRIEEKVKEKAERATEREKEAEEPATTASAKKKPTIHSCWMECLKDFSFDIDARNDLSLTKYEKAKLKKAIAGTSVTTERLGTEEEGMDVLVLTVPEAAGVAEAVLRHLPTVDYLFLPYFGENVFITRVICRGRDFDQYIMEPGPNEGFLPLLKAALSEDDYAEKCEASRWNTGCPGWTDVRDAVVKVAQEMTGEGLLPKFNVEMCGDEETYLSSVRKDVAFLSVRTIPALTDEDLGLMGLLNLVTAATVFVDVGRSDLFEGLKAALPEFERRLRRFDMMQDIELRLFGVSGCSTKVMETALRRIDEGIPASERRMHRVGRRTNKPLRFSVNDDLLDGIERRAQADGVEPQAVLESALAAYLDGGGAAPIPQAAPQPPEATPQPIISTSSVIMENEKPVFTSLDATNPHGTNEPLRPVTTRALLRELRERGVTFEKVSVPVVVRQEVSLDDI